MTSSLAGRWLDLKTWKRREHYELFRSVSQPFFSVTVDVDVTDLREGCRRAGHSFFLAALYSMLRAANDTEAFRLRLRPEGVWVHDRVRTSSTLMRADDTFAFGIFEHADSFAEFEERGRREVERACSAATLTLPDDDDLIYHSSLPWLRFTSFTNAIDVGADSVPRVVFGQYHETNGRSLMPVAVEVHHALVDGVDSARFIERLQERLDS